jgi:hypothetical protein
VVGASAGAPVTGAGEGDREGRGVGSSVLGASEGVSLGAWLGAPLGASDGAWLGAVEGTAEGCAVGSGVGARVPVSGRYCGSEMTEKPQPVLSRRTMNLAGVPGPCAVLQHRYWPSSLLSEIVVPFMTKRVPTDCAARPLSGRSARRPASGGMPNSALLSHCTSSSR